MNAALILSGGSGTRMGEDCPKQFLPIGGVPILCRTVQSFCSHPEIDCIMVVCSADMLDQTRSLLLPFHTKKPLFFASGGKTRQASSKNGLLALSAQCTQPDIVLIHDAARPLIPHSVISRCIAGAKTHGACTAAIPTQDTIAAADADGFIHCIPDRSMLHQIQTPQAFSFSLILQAHLSLSGDAAVTDDTAVARLAGHDVFIVQGDKRSLKITTKEDLRFAESLLTDCGFDC